MKLSPTYLIYRTGFASTNGTSVQLHRLFQGAKESLVHLMWNAGEAGRESVRWIVNTDDTVTWRRPFGRPGALCQRALTLLGLSWWRATHLNAAKLRRALDGIPVKPRQALVICVAEWDAVRACALWQAVGRPPFVLHVLDILEPEVSEAKTPNFVRLVRAASHVLCLNRVIENEMKRAGARETSLLPLCSDMLPTPRTMPVGPLKILISGALYADLAGENRAMRLLVEAWPAVEQTFPGAELHYAGVSSAALPAGLRSRVRDHGLLDPKEAYPALSRSCHVAYVPVSHLRDTPLRYSLPSRIPDYLMCGLPVIACTHEGTGIHEFFGSAPRACTRLVDDSSGFLSVLREFAGNRESWERASHAATDYAGTAFSVTTAREKLFSRLNAAGATAIPAP